MEKKSTTRLFCTSPIRLCTRCVHNQNLVIKLSYNSLKRLDKSGETENRHSYQRMTRFKYCVNFILIVSQYKKAYSIATQNELEIFLEIIASFPDGIAIEQLIKLLPFQIEKRALQRRLKSLREKNLIRLKGEARSTRYFSNIIDHSHSPKKIEPTDEPQSTIPLSPEGKDALTSVSPPEIQRIPAGYDRSFLENYRLNIDSFLSGEKKKKLAE